MSGSGARTVRGVAHRDERSVWFASGVTSEDTCCRSKSRARKPNYFNGRAMRIAAQYRWSVDILTSGAGSAPRAAIGSKASMTATKRFRIDGAYAR